MEDWKELVLSLPGLPNGVTEIETTVTADFFARFEQSPICEANYKAQIFLDKKPGLYILGIRAEGWHETDCDRCLERIRIPGEASGQYYFNQKGHGEAVENDEVIIMDESAVELDLRPILYESIVLSLPMINVYDCENDDQAPCDRKILEILQGKEADEAESTNPSWDELKNIKFDEK